MDTRLLFPAPRGGVLQQRRFYSDVWRLACKAAGMVGATGAVAELIADASAVQAIDGATAPLASAMLAFGAAASGDVVGISPDRVDSLLGQPSAWRLPRLLLIAALMTIAALLALVWRASGSASAQTSLNLPMASSQPCLLVLALAPILACIAGAVRFTPAADKLTTVIGRPSMRYAGGHWAPIHSVRWSCIGGCARLASNVRRFGVGGPETAISRAAPTGASGALIARIVLGRLMQR